MKLIPITETKEKSYPSKLSRAIPTRKTKKIYLKTNVPKRIVDHFNLKVGHTLKWNIYKKNGDEIIIVTPEKE